MIDTNLILYSVLAIIGGGVVLFLSSRFMQTDQATLRLKEIIEEEETKGPTRQEISLRSRRYTGSFINRTVVPAVRGVVQFLGRLTPGAAIEGIRKQLVIAGNPLNLGPREFFGLCVALGLVGVWLAFIILQRETSMRNALMAMGIVPLTTLLPVMWLRQKVQYRQNRIRKGLPDALDMLSICATAGLGFDQALQRISDHWNTPVGIEFSRVIAEIEMGISRRDVLRNMADRLEVGELSSFVAFVLQSEQLGMSISDTLHTQAAQMRVERRFRAQEQAQKIPSKMLIPMVFLIFPALLAVILGPAIPDLINIFGTI